MARTLSQALNESNPNKIASALQSLECGNAFAAAPVFYKGTVTSNVLTLPENARAAYGLVALATAGSVAGVKTFTLGTVATTEFAIDGAGNIVFFGADAVTSAEVWYIPVQGDVIEEGVPVASSVATFSASRGSVLVLSAAVTTGIITGSKIVDARAGTPGAGHVSLSLVGTSVAFNAADVISGYATIRYVVTPGTGNTVSLVNKLNSETNL